MISRPQWLQNWQSKFNSLVLHTNHHPINVTECVMALYVGLLYLQLSEEQKNLFIISLKVQQKMRENTGKRNICRNSRRHHMR
jgi:hypothetical protein